MSDEKKNLSRALRKQKSGRFPKHLGNLILNFLREVTRKGVNEAFLRKSY